jgi:hypothetical protein
MQHRLELSKFAELRAKTDRQLVALINKRLDAGLGFALQLVEMDPRDSWSTLEETRAHAEKAYEEALLWIPTVSGLNHTSLARLRRRLAELRDLLDDASARRPVHMHACS